MARSGTTVRVSPFAAPGGHDEHHDEARDGDEARDLGSLRKLPSGRLQARYPAPDGEMYPARKEDDKPLTFLTKTDARTWPAGVHTKIARGEWEPPSIVAARRRADAEAEEARSIGFAEYAERWIEFIRLEPTPGERSGRSPRCVPTRARSLDT